MRDFLFFALSVANLFQLTIQADFESRATTPHKNIWRLLSEEELRSTSDVLIQKLNLTTTPDGSGRNNIILQIDLLQPNKSDVLPFLDSYAGAPKRYARATVQYGSFEEPYLQEYVIGPLPATNATAVMSLQFPFNNDKPGRTRLPSIFAADVESFLEQLSSDVEDITRAIWNTTILEGGSLPRLGKVTFQEDGTQRVWVTFIGPPTSGFESISLLPLGIFFRLEITSRDWKDWSVDAWYYRGQMYNGTDAFRAVVLASDFPAPPPNVDGPWTSTDKQGESLPLDDLPPPVTVSQGADRYSIDVQEGFVSWMDFGFFLSTSTDQGLSLFDITYKGKRIIYELALQEALAHYSGADPVQSETLYFDTSEGMGRNIASLVKGHDCPIHATYLPTNYTDATGVKTTPNGICIFEADVNFPIRRHYATNFGYTSVAKNIVFTVRWISTIDNYDYLFDYNFFYDGAIEVVVRASGYILGAYYADNEEYGFRIHDFLSGSLHEHVMTFKVDLDILGEKNSVQKVEILAATEVYPWSDGQSHNTIKLKKSFVSSEAESSINWSGNEAASYSIVSKDSPNRYGEYPGYKFKRSASTSHLSAINSTNAGKAANYATSDFYITKQKDSEPRAADRNNYYDVQGPLVDFSKFMDGDSLAQEDLVLWFNLGMHHIPHTGDLPNTIMTSAHSALRIEPLNYLEYDPSIATSQQIRVNQTAE
ncbi:amine oxidase catalytic domain-containing protein [Massarina eburnea CBS 473.64]|uniref:Amine oxidase n=1 Tax=Massarina eburnea CBS 473.64 TaxID=1395130 RepID=A0A6A6SKS8_9PLEO|nr:amine oxidase catalytic domain-containing protein [Massarina eburnea CBS 473.64]